MSGAIEILQQWPEVIPLGHALGEVLRNLGYALCTGILLSWLLVTFPARQAQLNLYRPLWPMLTFYSSAGERCANLLRDLAGAPAGSADVSQDEVRNLLQQIVPGPPVESDAPLEDLGHGYPINLARLTQFALVGPMEDTVTPHLDRLDAEVAVAATAFSGRSERLIVLRADAEGKMLDLSSLSPRVWGMIKASYALRDALRKYVPELDLDTPYKHWLSRDDQLFPE